MTRVEEIAGNIERLCRQLLRAHRAEAIADGGRDWRMRTRIHAYNLRVMADAIERRIERKLTRASDGQV